MGYTLVKAPLCLKGLLKALPWAYSTMYKVVLKVVPGPTLLSSNTGSGSYIICVPTKNGRIYKVTAIPTGTSVGSTGTSQVTRI